MAAFTSGGPVADDGVGDARAVRGVAEADLLLERRRPVAARRRRRRGASAIVSRRGDELVAAPVHGPDDRWRRAVVADGPARRLDPLVSADSLTKRSPQTLSSSSDFGTTTRRGGATR